MKLDKRLLCDRTHTRYKKHKGWHVVRILMKKKIKSQNATCSPSDSSIWFNILGNFQIKNDETVLCSCYPARVIKLQSLPCFVLLDLAFQLLFSVFNPLKQKKKRKQVPKQLPILLVGLIIKYPSFDGFCIKNTWNIPFQCFSSQFWNFT